MAAKKLAIGLNLNLDPTKMMPGKMKLAKKNDESNPSGKITHSTRAKIGNKRKKAKGPKFVASPSTADGDESVASPGSENAEQLSPSPAADAAPVADEAPVAAAPAPVAAAPVAVAAPAAAPVLEKPVIEEKVPESKPKKIPGLSSNAMRLPVGPLPTLKPLSPLASSSSKKDSPERQKLGEAIQGASEFYDKILSQFQREFMGPIQRGAKMIDADDSQALALFANMSALVKLQKSINAELNALKKPGETFAKFGSNFVDAYKEFLARFVDAIKTYCLLREKQKFLVFANAMKEGRNIEYMLCIVQPLEYILKIDKLISDYNDLTPADHPEKAELEKFVHALSAIADPLAIDKFKFDNMARICQIQDSITKHKLNLDLLNKTRYLLHIGYLKKVRGLLKRDNLRQFFLFNDILLWCDDKFDYKGHVKINSIAFSEWNQKNSFGIEIKENEEKNSFVLLCENEKDRNLWIESLKRAANPVREAVAQDYDNTYKDEDDQADAAAIKQSTQINKIQAIENEKQKAKEKELERLQQKIKDLELEQQRLKEKAEKDAKAKIEKDKADKEAKIKEAKEKETKEKEDKEAKTKDEKDGQTKVDKPQETKSEPETKIAAAAAAAVSAAPPTPVTNASTAAASAPGAATAAKPEEKKGVGALKDQLTKDGKALPVGPKTGANSPKKDSVSVPGAAKTTPKSSKDTKTSSSRGRSRSGSHSRDRSRSRSGSRSRSRSRSRTPSPTRDKKSSKSEAGASKSKSEDGKATGIAAARPAAGCRVCNVNCIVM